MADGGGLCCWNGEQACSSLQIRSRKICFVNPSLFKEEFLITTQQRTPLVLALISDSRMKPGLKTWISVPLSPCRKKEKKKTPNTQKRSSSMFLCLRSVFCSFLPWGQQKLHFFFFFLNADPPSVLEKKLGFERSRFGSPGDRFSPAFSLRSANPAWTGEF